MRTNRRQFLAGIGAAAPLGHLSAADAQVANDGLTRDYFADPGVKPFINAIGPYSSLGDAVMWPGVISSSISDIPGVATRVFISEGHAYELYLEFDWNPRRVRLTREQFVQALRDHDPSVEVRNFRFFGGRIHVSATVMDDGEDAAVGDVFRGILLAHV